MVFCLIFLLLIIFADIKFSKKDEFNIHYLDIKNTTAINGIFVILIVFSHYAQYADFSSIYDAPYIQLKNHLNQLVVVTFLFIRGME